MDNSSSPKDENAATLSPLSTSVQSVIDIALARRNEMFWKPALEDFALTFILLFVGVTLALVALSFAIVSRLFPLVLSREAAGEYVQVFSALSVVVVLLGLLANVVGDLLKGFHPMRDHIRRLQSRIVEEDAVIAQLVEFDVAVLQRALRRLALEHDTLFHRANSFIGDLGKTGVIATAAALVALYLHYRASQQAGIVVIDAVAAAILGLLLAAMIGHHFAARVSVAQYLIEEAIHEKVRHSSPQLAGLSSVQQANDPSDKSWERAPAGTLKEAEPLGQIIE